MPQTGPMSQQTVPLRRTGRRTWALVGASTLLLVAMVCLARVLRLVPRTYAARQPGSGVVLPSTTAYAVPLTLGVGCAVLAVLVVVLLVLRRPRPGRPDGTGG